MTIKSFDSFDANTSTCRLINFFDNLLAITTSGDNWPQRFHYALHINPVYKRSDICEGFASNMFFSNFLWSDIWIVVHMKSSSYETPDVAEAEWIHERTIWLRFLSIILRVLRLEIFVCTVLYFLIYMKGVWFSIRFSSFPLRLREFEGIEISRQSCRV